MSINEQVIQTNLDLVLCIDKTLSMQNVWKQTKKTALKMFDMIKDGFKSAGKDITSVRIKVIAFGAIEDHSCEPFIESPFYTIPQEKKKYEEFVKSINCEGGGNESGLNALAKAMMSDWNTASFRNRHAIIMFTDEGAHPLEQYRSDSNCPADSPESLVELNDIWNGITQMSSINMLAKRLILFAPTTYPYDILHKNFKNVYAYSDSGEYDVQNINMDSVISFMVASFKS